MRWMWIDRMTEFVRGKRATAVKCVSIVEEPIDGYAPGYPYHPHTLIIEGLAQTGGLLVGEVHDYRDRVVLAKIAKAEFHCMATPGAMLTYRAEVDDIRANGAIVRCTSTIRCPQTGSESPQASVDFVFAYLDDRFPADLFAPQQMWQMCRTFGIYDIGVDQEGNPIKPPPHMLAAERASFLEP
jgi:3-hydroxyacyl-[acyl-carrier-protein] dehydratase